MHDHGPRETESAARESADEGRDLRPLAIALAINTGFLLVEVTGALLADSLALLADAAHMLTDSASLGLALLAAWVAARPADERRTYGYHRAEVLGALANGVFLVVVVGYVAFDAIRRLGSPHEVDPGIVVLVGVLGLGANLAAAWVLSDHRESLNVEGAFVHLLADAAGSVGAILAGILIHLTGRSLFDPAIALLVAALVLYSAKDLLRDSLNVLLQGAPRDVDVEAVREILHGIEGVIDTHHLHVWALDSTRRALSVHVIVDPDADRDDVLDRCREAVSERGIDHLTIQIEPREDGRDAG